MGHLTGVVGDTPKVFDVVNVGYGAIISLLTLAFGEHWILFAGFLVLEILDWITGNYKARVLHKESSVKGAAGAMKKVWQLVVIGIAFYVSFSFMDMGKLIGVDLHFVTLFGWLTLAMYIVNELRSILENLVEIGVDVPEFLIKGLDVTKKLMDIKSESEEPKNGYEEVAPEVEEVDE